MGKLKAADSFGEISVLSQEAMVRVSFIFALQENIEDFFFEDLHCGHGKRLSTRNRQTGKGVESDNLFSIETHKNSNFSIFFFDFSKIYPK